jgi:hypothetical protein
MIRTVMRSKEVDHYLHRSPKHVRELMTFLRTIILKTIPDVEETIKFSVPFYSRQGLLCYLNPGKDGKGVYMGFVEGHRLSDESGILTGKKLKQIRYMEFHTRREIKVRVVKEYLLEAVMLNELKKHPFPL